MKAWRLVSGILSIVLAVFVAAQAVTLIPLLLTAQNPDYTAIAGFFVSALMLTGGIVSIVMRAGGKSAGVTLLILYGIAAYIAFSYTERFPDLKVWGAWCAICAGIGWFTASSESIRKWRQEHGDDFNPDNRN